MPENNRRSVSSNDSSRENNASSSQDRRFSRQGGRFKDSQEQAGKTEERNSSRSARKETRESSGPVRRESAAQSNEQSFTTEQPSGFQGLDNHAAFKRSGSRYGNQKRQSDRGIKLFGTNSGGSDQEDGTSGGYRGYSVEAVKKQRNSNPLFMVAVGAVALVVVAVLVFAVYNVVVSSAAGVGEVTPGIDKEVFIPEGTITTGIAKILKDEGIILKDSSFINAVKERGAESMLKPGKYAMKTGMSDSDAIDMLVAGPTDLGGKTLTIPEGLTLEQTAKIVEAACAIPSDQFIAEARSASKYYAEDNQKYWFLQNAYNNSMEGFLSPKTYSIPEGSDAAYVIRVLLNQFVIETKNLDMSYAESKNLNIYDVMTIASMVEKETYTAEERDKVSSVMYNRLHNSMKLQICATVVYVLGPDARDYGVNPLLYVDLDTPSPYNTYLNDGLPPGPICSPQIASIEAAAHPAQTDFLYYVLTSKEGTHTFCATDEEFAAANTKYQEIFG
jgi:UPF0755 protein